jgi:uncharacterized protein (DUF1330 family)
MIIETEVNDEREYAEYVERVRAVVEKHGGQYLVRGGKVTPLSGDWNPERIIVIRFEAMEHVQRCFGSPEYSELAPRREKSAVSRAIVVDGI